MGRSSALGAFNFEVESAWGETNTTFTSRVAVLDSVDPSGLTHDKMPAARTVQYLQDYTHPVRGVMGGSFRTRLWLPGHGSTTAGAITVEELETLLGYVFGNVTSTGSGTTATAGATTTTIPTAAASGLTAGGIVFVGSLGDSGGAGQAAVVSSHAGSSLSLLTALPAAPANGAVVASSYCIYPNETASSATVPTIRALLLTANQQYACHGCYPQSVTIEGLSPGEVPSIVVEWGVSWWEPMAATFPTSNTVDTHNPAPSAAGSFFIQNRGTTTRQTYDVRELRVSIDLNTIVKRGPGGLNQYQAVTGAVRGGMSVEVSFVVDAESATTSPTWPGRWDSDSQDYHVLATWSGAATGRRGALYIPNACIVGAKPVQFSNNGINAERVTLRAKTGPTTTSELTLSAFRLALG